MKNKNIKAIPGKTLSKTKETWANDKFWIIALSVVATAILLAFVFVTMMSPERQVNGILTAKDDIQTANSDLQDLPEPQVIELGQKDTTLKFQTDELVLRVSEEVAFTHLPSINSMKFNVWRSEAALPDGFDINTLVSEYDAVDDEINQLYTYQLNVLSAMQGIFEYNTIADFAEVSPKLDYFDEKTTELIEQFEGYKQRLESLDARWEMDDPQMVSDINEVESIKASLESFKTHKDLNQLEEEVSASQKVIITNRQKFWITSRDNLTTKLQELNSQLTELETVIRQLPF